MKCKKCTEKHAARWCEVCGDKLTPTTSPPLETLETLITRIVEKNSTATLSRGDGSLVWVCAHGKWYSGGTWLEALQGYLRTYAPNKS